MPFSTDEYSTHYPPSGNTTTFSNNHESYATYSSTDRSPQSIHTLFGRLHQQFRFQSPADIEVHKLLKGNLYRTRSGKKSRPDEFHPQQPSTTCQFPSAASPQSAPFYHGDRSPNDSSDSYRSLQARAKRNSSGDAASTSPNYDFSGKEDMEMKDEKWLKRLRIHDTYVSGGRKRRAANPNNEHMSWRHESSSYGSPQDHFASPPPRSNSYPSTMSMSMHQTSITTVHSSGRRLPVGPSPGGISHSSWNTPDTATVSADLNLLTSISNQGLIHSRNISDTSTFEITEGQELRETMMQGVFVCDCCPEKPERFDTLVELM
ncbi:zinc finger protein [Fusarium beomiforme]|uniref:Zinc finger protein n=1 Tax=Fusarium beomiforme TaxID=44412 RepID=A0A9P5DXJ2_9HYPO|nr:zinc finger protein [Fusarium beomiforme]